MKGRRLLKRSLAIAMSLVVVLQSIPASAMENLVKKDPIVDMPVFYQPTENVQVDIPLVFVEEEEKADTLKVAVKAEVAQQPAMTETTEAESVKVKMVEETEQETVSEEITEAESVKEEEPIPVLAVSGDYEYEVEGNSYARITRYQGTDAKLVIPRELDGYPVREIGSSAFLGSIALTSVEIPASVTKIADSAFYGNYNLKEVILSEGITIIENYFIIIKWNFFIFPIIL